MIIQKQLQPLVILLFLSMSYNEKLEYQHFYTNTTDMWDANTLIISFYIILSFTFLLFLLFGENQVSIILAEEINGTEGADNITGTPNQDIIRGFAGNDVIEGMEQGDTISGGKGDDQIFGNEGRDWLKGKSGNDKIDGGPGNDMIYGNKGDDVLTGGEGNDKFFCGTGMDTIVDASVGDIVLPDCENLNTESPPPTPQKSNDTNNFIENSGAAVNDNVDFDADVNDNVDTHDGEFESDDDDESGSIFDFFK